MTNKNLFAGMTNEKLLISMNEEYKNWLIQNNFSVEKYINAGHTLLNDKEVALTKDQFIYLEDFLDKWHEATKEDLETNNL